MAQSRGQSGGVWQRVSLVDAHVHLHACFDPGRFLDSAFRNFRECAESLELEDGAGGVLLLADTAGQDSLRELQGAAAGARLNGWWLDATDEDCSIIARGADGKQLVLIAGRQIATREGLEVLALTWAGSVGDGLDLDRTIAAALEGDAVVVLPWGFGKWWFRRGSLIAGVVEGVEPGRVFLGDNGGRLWLGPRPKLFALAESRGVHVLPGSDPLPFPSHVGRAGSYGFALEGAIDPERPGASIRDRLRALVQGPRAYGRREGLGRFIYFQLAMQLKKRGSRWRREH